jgi:Flp pilus assembly pilin Flp
MIRSAKRMVRKGQAMVEYALLVVCIAVVGAVAVSMLGHKTADNLAIAAAIMPGAHTDDNNPIQTSQVMPTSIGSDGSIVIDTTGLLNSDRFSNVLGAGGGAQLVTAP